MAAFRGGQSSFQIFSDSSENQAGALRKTKRDEVSGKPPATKRAALGVITNTSRVQPVRAAKQGPPTEQPFGGFSENVPPKGQKSAFQFPQASNPFSGLGQSFKIHVDSSNTDSSSTSVHTDLRAPLLPINVDSSSPISEPADSPMLLDTSDIAVHENPKEANLQKILNVPEYTESIYKYLRETETRYQPSPYMKKQQDINNNMRSILVDWLIEVAEEYRLHRETLMLAVNYIDRFLSKMAVNRKKLQLVGAASMFLAAKYEEIYPPEVSEFVYITDNTYTKEEVLKMEHLILKVLSFDVAAPTINLFCERFLRDQGSTEEDAEYHIAMMLAELTMLDSDTYLKFLPSKVAASCVCLANHTVGKQSWPSHMEQTAKYSMAELNSCVQTLFHTYSQAPAHPQQACADKYKQSKLKEVASIPPPKVLPAGCTPLLS